MTEFTVFTPTYNRAKLLSRSYNALCNQTEKDFIWLIIDDGSVDNTRELVNSWISENKIKIEYYYQENAGKQRAVNNGINHCKTKYFAFLDSDDYYCQDTVEKFLIRLHEIDDNEKVSGVVACRGEQEGLTIGRENMPVGAYIINFDKVITKYKFKGDTCRAYKTEIIKNYLYPEIEDKFILEDVMLCAMDYDYDIYFVNEVYSITKYYSDGYTLNTKKLFRKNPKGYALGISQRTIARRGFLRRVKFTVMYTVWCKKHKIDNAYKTVKNKKLYVLLYPVSCLAYLLKMPKGYFENIKDE